MEEVLFGVRGRDEGDVHVSAVSWESGLWFGHEAWCDAVLAAEGFDDVFEEAGAVGHAADLAEFQRGFEDSWAGFGVPAFDVAVELAAGVVDAVVVGLVVDGAGEGVAEHAFGQGLQVGGDVSFEEGGGRGGVCGCGGGEGRVLGGTKLEEFILGWCESVNVVRMEWDGIVYLLP